ncbi:MAG: aldo/keto reductase, partial [Chloroflexi bacterium]|nr:aldo/keto reductase [Chloroflexota bacterium]
MRLKQLGQSSLLVSELALGTMLFDERSDRDTPAQVARQMIDAYIDRGGNHIDTANVYGGGRSESLIGAALTGGKRQRVILATKVRFGREDDHIYPGLSRRHIMIGVEDSLRRLQTDYIDLYY